MQSVQVGETLVAQGPQHYKTAAAAFYRGLKVYPNPAELLIIYRQAVPEQALDYVRQMVAKDVRMGVEACRLECDWLTCASAFFPSAVGTQRSHFTGPARGCACTSCGWCTESRRLAGRDRRRGPKGARPSRSKRHKHAARREQQQPGTERQQPGVGKGQQAPGRGAAGRVVCSSSCRASHDAARAQRRTHTWSERPDARVVRPGRHQPQPPCTGDCQQCTRGVVRGRRRAARRHPTGPRSRRSACSAAHDGAHVKDRSDTAGWNKGVFYFRNGKCSRGGTQYAAGPARTVAQMQRKAGARSLDAYVSTGSKSRGRTITFLSWVLKCAEPSRTPCVPRTIPFRALSAARNVV